MLFNPVKFALAHCMISNKQKSKRNNFWSQAILLLFFQMSSILVHIWNKNFGFFAIMAIILYQDLQCDKANLTGLNNICFY